jgi:lipoprotein signal peptidase
MGVLAALIIAFIILIIIRTRNNKWLMKQPKLSFMFAGA